MILLDKHMRKLVEKKNIWRIQKNLIPPNHLSQNVGLYQFADQSDPNLHGNILCDKSLKYYHVIFSQSNFLFDQKIRL